MFAAPTNMVFIPPGTFRMGSPTSEVDRYSNEGPQTEVRITRGFWLGKYPVTQSEYQALIGSNPSHFTGDPSLPVDSVSWSDATNYCVRLTQQERNGGRIPANCAYRLPTEAEREYACRAWTSTRLSYGDDPEYTNLTQYGYWEPPTHTVGQKLPNPWGLSDMHGNVVEWCQDWYSDSLPGGTASDPQGPPSGTYHVVRGGAWTWYPNPKSSCRSAFRSFYIFDPRFKFGDLGFRVVLAQDQL